MFTSGNKFGKGRPKKSITKPELLLPAVLVHSKIDWMKDFRLLYNIMKERVLNDVEKDRMKLLLQMMPYLCTKVQLKEIDGRQLTSPADSAAMAEQTSKLLAALENENAKPSTAPDSGQ